jgi:hypothetical protein
MDFNIAYNQHRYKITATPEHMNGKQRIPSKFRITLDGYSMGVLTCISEQWKSDNIIDQSLVDLIGSYISQLYVIQQ